jgi:hypothetical protein
MPTGSTRSTSAGSPPALRLRVVPGTPLGCMELLRRSGVPIAGSRAVVVGRSVIVGRPVALLLVNADATVTVCHSKTRDLAGVCREADILIAAIGRPGMITAEFVKPGAAVIDVGTSPVEGRLLGDVDRASVEPVAGWLTPVPGGVGPMTIAMLLRNTLALARARRPHRPPDAGHHRPLVGAGGPQALRPSLHGQLQRRRRRTGRGGGGERGRPPLLPPIPDRGPRPRRRAVRR